MKGPQQRDTRRLKLNMASRLGVTRAVCDRRTYAEINNRHHSERVAG